MVAVALVVAVLALRNIAGESLVPSALYVPVNLGVTAVLATVACRTRMSADEIGLGRAQAARGLATGAVVAMIVCSVIAIGAALPLTGDFFEDERVASIGSGSELAYQAVIRIPLGTALLEEFAFRGLLLGLLARRHSVAVAVTMSSFLFGLWHIRPTLGALDTNDLAGGTVARAAAVAGAVVATSVGGALFCWLRLRAHSLLAPAIVHAATNSAATVAAYVALRVARTP